jgi:hypothetical protein
MVQIQVLVQLRQQVEDQEVLQFHHKNQDNQEDQVVVVLGNVDQVMLEVVIHLQSVLLKELMVEQVQEALVMQEAEVEEHFQLVELPQQQQVEQEVVEQHLVLQDHQ